MRIKLCVVLYVFPPTHTKLYYEINNIFFLFSFVLGMFPFMVWNTIGGDSFDDMLDEYSLDVVTPHQSKLNSKMDTPGGDSFDDLLGEDSDDIIAAMFQTKNPQTQPTSGNLFSPPKGIAVLDKDDLADLGDEDDDDF